MNLLKTLSGSFRGPAVGSRYLVGLCTWGFITSPVQVLYVKQLLITYLQGKKIIPHIRTVCTSEKVGVTSFYLMTGNYLFGKKKKVIFNESHWFSKMCLSVASVPFYPVAEHLLAV